MGAENIKLVAVSEADKLILANLFQLYRYDSSEFNEDDIDAFGKFAISSHFDLYWTEAERYPFFIELGTQLVGFVLAREFAPENYSVAEFFVMRKYRRAGTGKRAAFLLFDKFPAEWHVAQEESNLAAQAFWKAVVAEYTKGNYEEGFSRSQPKGPKLIFHT